jgi:hypothetical protein
MTASINRKMSAVNNWSSKYAITLRTVPVKIRQFVNNDWVIVLRYFQLRINCGIAQMTKHNPEIVSSKLLIEIMAGLAYGHGNIMFYIRTHD